MLLIFRSCGSMNSKSFGGWEMDQFCLFSSKMLVKIATRKCFHVTKKTSWIHIEEKTHTLSLSRSPTLKGFWPLTSLHLSIHPIKPANLWKTQGMLMWGIPTGCIIISHWQTPSSPQNIASPTARFPKYRRWPVASNNSSIGAEWGCSNGE